MPSPRLPYVTEEAIVRFFGPVVAKRGHAYSRDSNVETLDWNAAALTLTAEVLGTESEPYQVSVALKPVGSAGGGALVAYTPVRSTCSCPVGMTCKHGAAALFTSSLHAMREELAGNRAATPSSHQPHPAQHSPRSSGSSRDAAGAPLSGTAPTRSGQHSSEAGSQTSATGWRARVLRGGSAQEAGGTAPGAGASTDSWRSVLSHVTRAVSTEPSDELALGFDLLVRPRSHWYDHHGAHSATASDLQGDASLQVGMRPLQRGRKGGWIKGDLNWRSFVQPSLMRRFDREQAALLGQIYRLYLAVHQGYPSDGQNITLADFSDSVVWRLLGLAQQAGVQFVGVGLVSSVTLGDQGDVGIDVSTWGNGLILHPWAEGDGTRLERPMLLGTSGVAGLLPRMDARTQDHRGAVDLGVYPAARAFNPQIEMLFERGDLSVPGAETTDFYEKVYPELQTTVAVRAADPAVRLPTVAAPRLQLLADYGDEDDLTLTWTWNYFDPPRSLPLRTAADRGDARRNVPHEDHVLTSARSAWDDAAHGAVQHLRGVATADFTVHSLPRLHTVEDLDVTVIGDVPSYEELEGTPQISVEMYGSERTDWFDLGIMIRIDGHDIPFGKMFKALASGAAKMKLADNTFFSLDHPNLHRLRELLREGELLGEWDSVKPGIGRYQVDFFEELSEIADDTEPTEEWTHALSALREVETIPMVPVPPSVKADLREYQVEGFNWLAFLHDHHLGGILADDMGLGKTLQTLTLIAHARAGHSGQGHAGERCDPGTQAAPNVQESSIPSAPPFLVVAPTSVVGVWKTEAARFVPHLTVTVLDSTSRKRGTPIAQAITGADVVVTSYTLLRTDAAEYAQQEWAGLILDEAQAVKNSASKVYRAARGINAPFRLAITGTPMENSLSDLWSLLSLTASGLFPSAKLFKENYIGVIEDGIDPARMSKLRRRVRPFMLRRSKDLVATDLPEKQDFIETVPLAPRHRRLYDRVLQRERKKVLGLLSKMEDGANRMTVFRSLTLLRMLALDPGIVKGVDSEGLPSSKLDALLERLDDAVGDGHRIIVFSQFTSFLQRVRDALEDRGVPYSYLDGSVSMRSREATVREFREGEAPVFLISLKAGGSGLTLTEADYVFLMDPWWNPAVEAQAIDRAHRIGQDKPVMVYRLVAEDTIEEKVLALQQKKAQLFTDLVDGEGGFSAGITAADVRELFGE